LAFSPDGQTLASGSLDGIIILWDVASGQSLGKLLTGRDVSVNSVAFSSDGQTLASGSRDGTIILWDVASRKSFGEPLTGHDLQVNSLAFSPDGQTLASGSFDRTIILWDISFESWQSRACRRANRNMAQSEWTQFNVDPNISYQCTCLDLPPGEGVDDTFACQ
jgi:WD40 repeat protein